jgi:hypothetical protein
MNQSQSSTVQALFRVAIAIKSILYSLALQHCNWTPSHRIPLSFLKLLLFFPSFNAAPLPLSFEPMFQQLSFASQLQ